MTLRHAIVFSVLAACVLVAVWGGYELSSGGIVPASAGAERVRQVPADQGPRASLEAEGSVPERVSLPGEQALDAPSAVETQPDADLFAVDVLVLEGGFPAEGVDVLLREGGDWRPAARTAANGRCRVEFAGGTASFVKARSDDGAESTAAGVKDGEDVVLELIAPSTLVVRTVWSDRSAAPLTKVQVVRSAHPHGFDRARVPNDELTTDHFGLLELRLHPSVASITMAAELKSGENSAPGTCTLRPGGSTELVLTIVDPSTVRVRVLDPQSRPVAGADVLAVWLSEENGKKLVAPTDADGVAVLGPLRPGLVAVAAEKEGTAGTRSEQLTISEASAAYDVTLRMVEAASIEGRVYWEDGRKVEPMIVAAMFERPEDFPKRPGEDPMLRHVSGMVQTTCDVDGSFALHPLRPDASEYRVVAVPDPTCTRCLVEERAVLPGTTDLVIALTDERVKGAFVFGDVESEPGGPVSPLSVVVFRKKTTGDWIQDGSMVVMESSEERYEIVGLREGVEYALTVSGGSGLTAYVRPFTASLEGTCRDVVLPTPRRVTVRGPAGMVYPRTAEGTAARVIAHLAFDDFPYQSPATAVLGRRGEGELTLGAAPYVIEVVQGDMESRKVEYDATLPVRESVLRLEMDD